MKTLLLALLSLASLSYSAEPITDTEVENAAIVAFLNSATPEELAEVKGIGATLAARITDARPYAAPADVLAVKGIGTVIASRLFVYALDGLDN